MLRGPSYYLGDRYCAASRQHTSELSVEEQRNEMKRGKLQFLVTTSVYMVDKPREEPEGRTRGKNQGKNLNGKHERNTRYTVLVRITCYETLCRDSNAIPGNDRNDVGAESSTV